MRSTVLVLGIVASTLTLGIALVSYAENRFASRQIVSILLDDVKEIKRDVKHLLKGKEK